MRATCEQCAAPQPPGWRPGDLCTSCGQAVRHEVRCFWCTEWTPAGAFCRSCGADLVEERLYGAARMLKDAGSDRFSIPTLLTTLGDDRIENFTRIYQRHAATAARHVDELHEIEQLLTDRHWSATLDDELARQLPWSSDELARCSANVAPPGEGLVRVTAIGDTTPIALTSRLALLARVALDDVDALAEASGLLDDADPAISLEAALRLSHWRVGALVGRLDVSRRIGEVLAAAVHTPEVLVHLGGRGELDGQGSSGDVAGELPPDDVLGSDDLPFAAALVRCDVDRLSATLRHGDVVTRCAAGAVLAANGQFGEIGTSLVEGPDEVRRAVLDALTASTADTTILVDDLATVVEICDDPRIRRRAARVAAPWLDAAAAMRIARAGIDDRAIVQTVLQSPCTDTEVVTAIADLLIEHGGFAAEQYGLTTVADDGRLPDGFVPQRWVDADDAVRLELLRVAERQLTARGDEALHLFVIGQVFAGNEASLTAAAAWVLQRWYRSQGDHRGEGPFVLDAAGVRAVFGDAAGFASRAARLLVDPDAMREVGVYEWVGHLLDTIDDEVVGELQDGRTGRVLLDALGEAVQRDLWPFTLEAIYRLTARLGAVESWRAEALEALQRADRTGNYHYDKAVEALTVGTATLPME